MEFENTVRTEVMNLLGEAKNYAGVEITNLELLPNEVELSEYPSLLLRVSEDDPPRFYLINTDHPDVRGKLTKL